MAAIHFLDRPLAAMRWVRESLARNDMVVNHPAWLVVWRALRPLLCHFLAQHTAQDERWAPVQFAARLRGRGPLSRRVRTDLTTLAALADWQAGEGDEALATLDRDWMLRHLPRVSANGQKALEMSWPLVRTDRRGIWASRESLVWSDMPLWNGWSEESGYPDNPIRQRVAIALNSPGIDRRFLTSLQILRSLRSDGLIVLDEHAGTASLTFLGRWIRDPESREPHPLPRVVETQNTFPPVLRHFATDPQMMACALAGLGFSVCDPRVAYVVDQFARLHGRSYEENARALRDLLENRNLHSFTWMRDAMMAWPIPAHFWASPGDAQEPPAHVALQLFPTLTVLR